MSNVVISYVNFANSGSVANAGGAAFEASAPLSNVLTPRLGQKAIQASMPANMLFDVFIEPGSPTYSAKVGVIAILNHNILSMDDATDLEITAHFTDGTTESSLGEVDGDLIVRVVGSDGAFQNHIIWVPTAPAFNIKRVWKVTFYVSNIGFTVTGTKNSYTGEVTPENPSIGGVWIGPAFRPTNGISIEGFGQSIEDNSRVLRSIGGQVWTSPEVRQRACSIEFAGLLESEVYALSPEQSLLQLAAYCGVSRPIIAIPISSDEELMYLQGIYGYMPSTPKWQSVNKVLDPDSPGAKVRLYTGSLEIIEAR